MDDLIGTPHPRVDGRLKVTGAARYAAEWPEANLAHARLVTSRIARGRVIRIDATPAQAVPGLLLVLSHLNAERLVPIEGAYPNGQAQTTFLPLQSDEIRYAGQPVALVVAETPEAAEHAASLVAVDYAPEPARVVLESHLDAVETAAGTEDVEVGQADAAFAASPVRVEAEYETPPEHHNPIELYSTMASWRDGRLTVHEPSQWVPGLRAFMAERFGLDQDQVRVVSPYIGGAFGCKACPMPHSALTALAARRLERSVKLVVSREQGFFVGPFRAGSVSRVRLGATPDGRLTAYMHDYVTQGSRTDRRGTPGVESPAMLYAAPTIHGRDRFVALDLNNPGPMRAPAEMPSVFALESAMDELAHQVGVDPVELRLRNDAGDRDPVTRQLFSSRSLAACYRRGMEIFGWSRRPLPPRSMTAGDWLVGWGCASSLYPVYIGPASARLRLSAEGRASVQLAGQDIGTGLYTVVAGLVAERLGLPLDRVRVEMGDSDLPFGSMAAGSRGTASVAPAVARACDEARARVLALAGAEGPLAGLQPDAMRLADGQVQASRGSGLSVRCETSWRARPAASST